MKTINDVITAWEEEIIAAKTDRSNFLLLDNVGHSRNYVYLSETGLHIGDNTQEIRKEHISFGGYCASRERAKKQIENVRLREDMHFQEAKGTPYATNYSEFL